MRGQREGPWGRTGLDVFPVQQVQLLLTPGNGSVTHRNTALEDWHLVPTPGPHLCRASRPSLGPPPPTVPNRISRPWYPWPLYHGQASSVRAVWLRWGPAGMLGVLRQAPRSDLSLQAR